MNLETIKQQLKKHEGYRQFPYKDTVGKITIAIGRNLDDVGISHSEAMYLLDNDIRKHLRDLLRIFSEWNRLPEPIQHVLIDMHFNLGSGGFRSFKKMITAIHDRNWQNMKREMADSRWAEQVGFRATDLIEMVGEVMED